MSKRDNALKGQDTLGCLPPFLQGETTVFTSCSLSFTPITFYKASTLKKKEFASLLKRGLTLN